MTEAVRWGQRRQLLSVGCLCWQYSPPFGLGRQQPRFGPARCFQGLQRVVEAVSAAFDDLCLFSFCLTLDSSQGQRQLGLLV